MAMQPSEKAFQDLKALGASAGVDKSVFQHITAADLDAIGQSSSMTRAQATRKHMANAVVSSLEESGGYLKAAKTSRVVQAAIADATVQGRGVVADETYGYVSKSVVDAGKMMDNLRGRDPKFFAAVCSRIESSAQNLAALKKISPAMHEVRGKEIFEGNVTAASIREWVAGNATPVAASQPKPTVPSAKM